MERVKIAELDSEEFDYYRQNMHHQTVSLLKREFFGRLYELKYVCGVGTIVCHGHRVWRVSNPFKSLDETIEEIDDLLYCGGVSPRELQKMPWTIHALDSELARYSAGEAIVKMNVTADETEFVAWLSVSELKDKGEYDEGIMMAPDGRVYSARGKNPYEAMKNLEECCQASLRVE